MSANDTHWVAADAAASVEQRLEKRIGELEAGANPKPDSASTEDAQARVTEAARVKLEALDREDGERDAKLLAQLKGIWEAGLEENSMAGELDRLYGKEGFDAAVALATGQRLAAQAGKAALENFLAEMMPELDAPRRRDVKRQVAGAQRAELVANIEKIKQERRSDDVEAVLADPAGYAALAELQAQLSQRLADEDTAIYKVLGVLRLRVGAVQHRRTADEGGGTYSEEEEIPNTWHLTPDEPAEPDSEVTVTVAPAAYNAAVENPFTAEIPVWAVAAILHYGDHLEVLDLDSFHEAPTEVRITWRRDEGEAVPDLIVWAGYEEPATQTSYTDSQGRDRVSDHAAYDKEVWGFDSAELKPKDEPEWEPPPRGRQVAWTTGPSGETVPLYEGDTPLRQSVREQMRRERRLRE